MMVAGLKKCVKYLNSINIQQTTANILLCVRGVLGYLLEDKELPFNLGEVIQNPCSLWHF